MRRVLIFRNELLPKSETFIRAQAMGLHDFEACFAAVHPALSSLELPTEPLFVSPLATLVGKLRRRLFWRTGFAPGFYRRIATMKPELVHAHFATDGVAALYLCRRLRVPLIVTLHGYDLTTPDEAMSGSEEGRLYLRKRDALWERASLFVCVSEFIRLKALAKGFPREKLRVRYIGIDLSVFTQQSEERDRNLIVFTGRLIEKKGCGYLLDALAIVREQIPQAHVVVIGGGPMDEKLWQQVLERRLPCEFLGVQPADVVRKYLAKARIFCVPSVRGHEADGEGLGMVFAEAQAMGTPVVSFLQGGIPEVVRDGVTGLLAPHGDTKALALRLVTLLRDDAMWAEFSKNGVAWIRERFDVDKQTVELEQIYTDVLDQRANLRG